MHHDLTRISLLIALDHLETEACLISAETSEQKARALIAEMSLACCLTDRPLDQPPFVVGVEGERG